MTSSPFTPGSTVVRRDLHRGRVWSAQPYRALDDTGTVLHLAYWPGIRSLAPSSWTTALRTGDDTARLRGLTALAAGDWTLDPWDWRATAVHARFETGEAFSVHRFHDPATGAPQRLYVNFERPVTRTALGIDTFDLFLDLVVAPDLTRHRWKDEDEYAHGRRLGIVTDADHRLVSDARDRALARLAARTGPFADPAPAWTPDPGWPLPRLPAGADRA